MNYEEQDYDEIFKAVLDDSVEMGLISKAESRKCWRCYVRITQYS